MEFELIIDWWDLLLKCSVAFKFSWKPLNVWKNTGSISMIESFSTIGASLNGFSRVTKTAPGVRNQWETLDSRRCMHHLAYWFLLSCNRWQKEKSLRNKSNICTWKCGHVVIHHPSANNLERRKMTTKDHEQEQRWQHKRVKKSDIQEDRRTKWRDGGLAE